MRPPPRLFGIVATRAPVVAVLRRGPTRWCQVGRWDLEAPAWEPGAWLHGTIYPQKCDLSPDGRWLLTSILKIGATWEAGRIYEAVSRLPWLHALAAWEAGTTYTRGLHFTGEPGRSEVGRPDEGEAEPILRRYGLGVTRPAQFAVERRRGWTEAPDSEPRGPGDAWDQWRRARMRRPRPPRGGEPDPGGPEGTAVELRVEGLAAAFRTGLHDDDPPRYTLRSGGRERQLDGVQWADWDARGRLLVATSDGRLQIRDGPGDDLREVAFEVDLGPLEPETRPAPAWARRW